MRFDDNRKAIQIGNLVPKAHKADRMTTKEILEEAKEKIWGKDNDKEKQIQAQENVEANTKKLERMKARAAKKAEREAKKARGK